MPYTVSKYMYMYMHFFFGIASTTKYAITPSPLVYQLIDCKT